MGDARDRLIVGLDVPTVSDAKAIVNKLGDDVTWYKIGYQLAFVGGLDLAGALVERGKSVFLDMKLLDIDNTVEKGVAAVAGMGVSMLTIHAYPNAMRSAVKAAQGSSLCLLGVTVLTSMDAADTEAAGYAFPPSDLVERRARDAAEAGMGGIVASAHEAARIRPLIGATMVLVTPGIRPEGAAAGDQKRVATPAAAISSGASHLVVARPIVNADDPRAAAKAILREIDGALDV